MKDLDKAALIKHIKKRANAQAALPAAAVLDALALQLERGDFDTKEGGKTNGERTCGDTPRHVE